MIEQALLLMVRKPPVSVVAIGMQSQTPVLSAVRLIVEPAGATSG